MTTPSWDLSIAYQSVSDQKIQHDIDTIKQIITSLNQPKETSIAALQQALVSHENACVHVDTLSSFANCLASVDAQDTAAKDLNVRIGQLNAQLSQSYSPYLDKISNLSETQFQALLVGSQQTGSLQHLHFQLDRHRQLREQCLSIKEEQLLTAMNVDGRHAWGRLYNNLTGNLQVTLKLKNGQTETLGLSQAASILYGSDDLRREPAWKAINEIMRVHQHSLSAILNALAGGRLAEYEKRSFNKPVHFLDPSLHASCIEKSTLDALISVTKKNQQIGRKAGSVMAKLFATETLKPWDELASMPAIKGLAATQQYSFTQGIDIIREAFTGIDTEMGNFVDYMLENQLIDAAVQPNKRLGAYCSSFDNSRTPLVFMTWGDSMSDVITLAHELGHAFHNWVLRDKPLAQSHYPMTLAETASIFAENVVRDALMAKAENETDKLAMLWEEAQSALALLINIPVRFEFEKAFYEQRQQGELSAEQLSCLMRETWEDWYAEVMTESNELFWASKLHFSISEISFYNYPYLFGYLFSKGVYAQRATKGSHFYADYKALLSDTGSMTAEQVVKKHLGMDIRQTDFWQQSLDLVSQQIDQFEQLVDSLDNI